MNSSPSPRGGRPSWSGMLRFGLVSFPVAAYNAHIERAGKVTFHQLHRDCHSRILYEKHCPIHGRVSNDEIVSGYEVAKDQYVEVDREELKELRTQGQPGLTIDSFVDPAKIDPIYLDGRMYLLAPDGAEAAEAYGVFLEGLIHKKRYGLGQILMSGRKQLALVRPYQGLIHVAMLNHAEEIRAAHGLPRPAGTKAQAKEVKLAEQLIESWTQKKFDFTAYEDEHLKKVNELLEAKAQEEGVVAAPEEEAEPQVVNLMDALRASLKSTGAHPGRKRATPTRAAASKRNRPSKARRRKAS